MGDNVSEQFAAAAGITQGHTDVENESKEGGPIDLEERDRFTVEGDEVRPKTPEEVEAVEPETEPEPKQPAPPAEKPAPKKRAAKKTAAKKTAAKKTTAKK